jgi:hypothetical protein
MRIRRGLAACLLAVALVTVPKIAGAQDSYVRVDGIVQWLSGQILTLSLDVPPGATYMMVGPYLVPLGGIRPTVNVDLTRLAQSEYAFMRPGERVTVIGVVTGEPRRVIATTIIRRSEETP